MKCTFREIYEWQDAIIAIYPKEEDKEGGK